MQTAGSHVRVGGQVGARAPASSPPPSGRANREAGGRGRGPPGRGRLTPPEVRSRAGRARSARRRASRLPAGHGAADFASPRRGGSGRVPGVPQVRRQLRGARAPRAGPAPSEEERWRRGQGRGARPPAPRNPFPGCWERFTLMLNFIFCN